MILKIENNMSNADIRKMIQQSEEDGHNLTDVQLEMSEEKLLDLNLGNNIIRYVYGLPVKIV